VTLCPEPLDAAPAVRRPVDGRGGGGGNGVGVVAPVAGATAVASNVPVTAAEGGEPTAADMAAAAILLQWATGSPHAPVPQAELSVVLSATGPAPLLRAALPDTLSAEGTAVLLTVIVAGCGARVASALGEAVLLPRLAALAAPAPRDLMKAIVSFAEAHWRATLPLYSLLGAAGDGQLVSGPAAEVLVRVAAVLTVQGAREALLVCCAGVWREEGVPVLEALLAKCKGEAGIAAALVSALERNVVGMEGSLRFGKLLFLCVKGVPEVCAQHSAGVRNAASKSTVFLAKRALALLERGS
jgi:hypothetical protein